MSLEKKMQKSPGEYLNDRSQDRTITARRDSLQFHIELRKNHFTTSVLAHRKRNRWPHVVAVPMKPALEFINDGTAQERAWIICEPDASLEGLLINIIPTREHSLEGQGDGTSNRLREIIMGTDSRDRRTTWCRIARNVQLTRTVNNKAQKKEKSGYWPTWLGWPLIVHPCTRWMTPACSVWIRPLCSMFMLS